MVQVKQWWMLGMAVLLSCCVGYLTTHLFSLKTNAILSISSLDVGQGDSILIRTPSHRLFLVDTGPSRDTIAALSAVLPLYVHALDAVLLTHPDLDHVGGTMAVLESFTVGELLRASSTKTGDVVESLEMLPVKTHFVQQGDLLMLDSAHTVYAEVLAPMSSWSPDDANDSSLVLKITYGATCFILSGDASVVVERALVHSYGEALDCDVLKVGHHGSDTSTSDMFVGYVSPQYAVISAGRDNDFGHPHQSVLNTLEQFSVSVHRTDLEGTITIRSDGTEVFID